MSERHACRVLKQPRGTQRYRPSQHKDEDRLTQAIVVLAGQYGRYGYRRITALLRHAGWRVGKDRVERIWRRGAEGTKEAEATGQAVAQRWLVRAAAAHPPWENGYCESFNSKMRDEFLNGEIFYSMKELRVLAERWRRHYNTVRPHSSLGYRPPAPETWLASTARQAEEPFATLTPPPPATSCIDPNSEIVALH